jgi:hypothetical protein
VGTQPSILRQFEDLILTQPPRRGVIDALDRGGAQFELRDLQARREFAIFTIQPFIVDEQAEELGLAQVLVVSAFEAVFQGGGQTEEFHGDQFLVGLFVQHVKAPGH